MRLLVVAMACVLMCVGCQKGNVLNSAEWEMEQNYWISGDQKTFALEAKDTSKVYAMEITLSHDAAFPYQNLYIKTNTVFPSGKEVESITSIELLQRTGDWAGDCMGQTCDITLPLQERFTFPEVGTYTWSVAPYMRVDTVVGIHRFAVVCLEASDQPTTSK